MNDSNHGQLAQVDEITKVLLDSGQRGDIETLSVADSNARVLADKIADLVTNDQITQADGAVAIERLQKAVEQAEVSLSATMRRLSREQHVASTRQRYYLKQDENP